MNGGKTYKNERYLIEILQDAKNIFKYEAPLIVKCFLKTLKYFIENGIEFSFSNSFSFVKILKKESKCYVTYRDETDIIPEHYIMKFKVSEQLKHYLNERRQFKSVRHRENLPDNLKRKKDIF